MKLNEMNDQQLTARYAELEKAQAATVTEMQEIVRIRSERDELAKAVAKLKEMTPTEKAALAKVLTADSVVSAEAVGKPGT